MARLACAHCGGTIVKSEDGPECINCGRPLYSAKIDYNLKRVYLPGAPGPRRSDTKVGGK